MSVDNVMKMSVDVEGMITPLADVSKSLKAMAKEQVEVAKSLVASAKKGDIFSFTLKSVGSQGEILTQKYKKLKTGFLDMGKAAKTATSQISILSKSQAELAKSSLESSLSAMSSRLNKDGRGSKEELQSQKLIDGVQPGSTEKQLQDAINYNEKLKAITLGRISAIKEIEASGFESKKALLAEDLANQKAHSEKTHIDQQATFDKIKSEYKAGLALSKEINTAKEVAARISLDSQLTNQKAYSEGVHVEQYKILESARSVAIAELALSKEINTAALSSKKVLLAEDLASQKAHSERVHAEQRRIFEAAMAWEKQAQKRKLDIFIQVETRKTSELRKQLDAQAAIEKQQRYDGAEKLTGDEASSAQGDLRASASKLNELKKSEEQQLAAAIKAIRESASAETIADANALLNKLKTINERRVTEARALEERLAQESKVAQDRKLAIFTQLAERATGVLRRELNKQAALEKEKRYAGTAKLTAGEANSASGSLSAEATKLTELRKAEAKRLADAINAIQKSASAETIADANRLLDELINLNNKRVAEKERILQEELAREKAVNNAKLDIFTRIQTRMTSELRRQVEARNREIEKELEAASGKLTGSEARSAKADFSAKLEEDDFKNYGDPKKAQEIMNKILAIKKGGSVRQLAIIQDMIDKEDALVQKQIAKADAETNRRVEHERQIRMKGLLHQINDSNRTNEQKLNAAKNALNEELMLKAKQSAAYSKLNERELRSEIARHERIISSTKKMTEQQQLAQARQAIAAKKNIKDQIISWKSLERVIMVLVVRRAMFMLMQKTRQAINTMAELNARITEIQTIAQSSQAAFDSWGDSIISMSNAFGFDVLDVASSRYQILSNQIARGVEETERFQATALEFARITRSTATQSVDLLSSALNSYSLSAENAEQMSAILFKTIELGRIRSQEIANTLGRASVIGAQLGISMSELGAMMAIMTNKGIKSTESLTLIRNVMMKLIKPTTEMKAAFDEWGVATGEQAIATFGLYGTMKKLEDRTRGTASALGELFGRIRATTGMTSIIADLQKYSDVLEEIQNGSKSSYAEAQDRLFQSSGEKYTREMNKMKNYFNEAFGQNAIDLIIAFDEHIADITETIKNLSLTLAAVATTLAGMWATKKISAIIAVFAEAKQGADLLTKSYQSLSLAQIETARAAGVAKTAMVSAWVSAGSFVGIMAITTAIFKMIDGIRDARKQASEAQQAIEEYQRSNTLYASELTTELERAAQEYKNLRQEVLQAYATTISYLKGKIVDEETLKTLEEAAKKAKKSAEIEIKSTQQHYTDMYDYVIGRIEEYKRAIEDAHKSQNQLIQDTRDYIRDKKSEYLEPDEQIDLLTPEINKAEREAKEAHDLFFNDTSDLDNRDAYIEKLERIKELNKELYSLQQEEYAEGDPKEIDDLKRKVAIAQQQLEESRRMYQATDGRSREDLLRSRERVIRLQEELSRAESADGPDGAPKEKEQAHFTEIQKQDQKILDAYEANNKASDAMIDNAESMAAKLKEAEAKFIEFMSEAYPDKVIAPELGMKKTRDETTQKFIESGDFEGIDFTDLATMVEEALATQAEFDAAVKNNEMINKNIEALINNTKALQEFTNMQLKMIEDANAKIKTETSIQTDTIDSLGDEVGWGDKGGKLDDIYDYLYYDQDPGNWEVDTFREALETYAAQVQGAKEDGLTPSEIAELIEGTKVLKNVAEEFSSAAEVLKNVESRGIGGEGLKDISRRNVITTQEFIKTLDKLIESQSKIDTAKAAGEGAQEKLTLGLDLMNETNTTLNGTTGRLVEELEKRREALLSEAETPEEKEAINKSADTERAALEKDYIPRMEAIGVLLGTIGDKTEALINIEKLNNRIIALKAQEQEYHDATMKYAEGKREEMKDAFGDEAKLKEIEERYAATQLKLDNGLANLATSLDNTVKAIAVANAKIASGKYAEGGVVGGVVALMAQPSRVYAAEGLYAGDRVDASLTAGEFVMNPRSTQRFYGALTGMNSGGSPANISNDYSTHSGDINVEIRESSNPRATARAVVNEVRRERSRGRLGGF